LLAKLGTSINPATNDNYTELNMHFLNKDAETAMGLFSSVLLKPTFPADELKQQIGNY